MSALRAMTLSATYQGAAAAPARPPTFRPERWPERVQRETRDARRGFARRRSRSVPAWVRKMPAQKLLERALADETDAGAVRLVEYRQAGRMRHGAHLRLAQAAQGKKRLRQGGGRDAMQEIALILGGVRRFQQFRNGRRCAEPAHSARWRSSRRPGAACTPEQMPNLISRLQRTSGFGVRPAAYSRRNELNTRSRYCSRETDAMQCNPQYFAYAPRVLEIRRRRAVARRRRPNWT